MSRKDALVIEEGRPTAHSAHVPKLPAILVIGRSTAELTACAAESIWASLEEGARRAVADRYDLRDQSSNCPPEPGVVARPVEFGPLPKTATGKIRKAELREREWAGREKRIN